MCKHCKYGEAVGEEGEEDEREGAKAHNTIGKLKTLKVGNKVGFNEDQKQTWGLVSCRAHVSHCHGTLSATTTTTTNNNNTQKLHFFLSLSIFEVLQLNIKV